MGVFPKNRQSRSPLMGETADLDYPASTPSPALSSCEEILMRISERQNWRAQLTAVAA
jgi:hypothetical protein